VLNWFALPCRYGAVSFLELNSTSNRFSYAVHTNYTAMHAAPIFTNLVRGAQPRRPTPHAQAFLTIIHRIDLIHTLYVRAGQ
jgi:hypothetical protein